MKTNCATKLKRNTHLIFLNYISREVSKYKSYQKSPVAFFILHCYPASARIVTALVSLGCGLTSPVGGRKRAGPIREPLRCGILNSLSDVCCNICLVGIFVVVVVYLFQLAFERHLALQGNNHFTYALWSMFITRQLKNRCLQS